MKELLYGRLLTEAELIQFQVKLDELESRKSFFEKNNRYYCSRCQSDPSWHAYLANGEFYCRQCIQMSRIVSNQRLYGLTEANAFPKLLEKPLAWKGQLSPQQAQASKEIIESIFQKETHLVWAVTGAGKTEMLFEGINAALLEGMRVAISSPRVDVCRELYPRIQAAFPEIEIALLHGEMEEPYRYTQLLILTSHQLLRFKEAFDVLVIDEIDAFPFYGNESLEAAAKAAVKKSSTTILLTATPDKDLQERVRRKELKASILPARYHGYPLPEPKFVWLGNWRKQLLKSPERTALIKKMGKLVKQKRRFLLFVPQIKWMQAFEPVLRKLFPDSAFEIVYASDPNRAEKVQAMRDETVDFLVTTTILERGVTFSNIDVLVLGAEDRIYTEAALVQIAGRVGRKSDYPTGEVLYYYYGKSQAMVAARKQIKNMNRLARERGLIRHEVPLLSP